MLVPTICFGLLFALMVLTLKRLKAAHIDLGRRLRLVTGPSLASPVAYLKAMRPISGKSRGRDLWREWKRHDANEKVRLIRKATMGTPRRPAVWVRIALGDPDLEVKRSVLERIGQSKWPVFYPVLHDALKEPNTGIRLIALKGLAGYRKSSLIPIFERYLHHPLTRFREVAIEGLCRVGDRRAMELLIGNPLPPMPQDSFAAPLSTAHHDGDSARTPMRRAA